MHVAALYSIALGCMRRLTDLHPLFCLQPFLPGTCEPVVKYTRYGVKQYGHVHTGPDFDADGIRVIASLPCGSHS